MRKALTPIISVVLLILLVTVSAGGAFLFITQVMGDLEETAGEAVSELPACSQVSIPVAYGDGFVLTNTGCDTITNVTVLVDGELVNVLLSEPLPEDDSTYVTFPENVTLYNDQDHLYKVALNNGFSTTKRIQEETASSTAGFYGRCEENSTSCSTDVFFTGDIVANDYPTCACCGDDNNEYFYNGSIGSTHYFCHDSEYYNTTIDTNEELCTYYDHEWVTNSGEYECTESFTNDAINTAGDYYATYSFEDEVGQEDDNISFIDWITDGATATVVKEYQNHNSVVNFSQSINGFTAKHTVSFTGQSLNTLELYMQSEVGQLQFWGYLSSNDLGIQILVQSDGLVKAYHGDGAGGTTHTVVTSTSSFPHIKVSWNCSSDTYSVWVDGVSLISNEPFREGYTGDSVDKLRIYSSSSSSIGYFDAFGDVQNDASYSEGDNTNPYGKPSNVSDFVDSHGLTPGSSLSVVTEWAGHKKVLRFKDDPATDASPSISHDLVDSTNGTREFYVGSDDVSNAYVQMRFRESAENYNFIFAIKSGYLSYYGSPGGWHDIMEAEDDRLYHVKVVWRSDQTFDIYIDGVKEVDNQDMSDYQTGIIEFLWIINYGDSDDFFYLDAYGDPDNDADYHTGDNLEQFGCCGDDKINDEFYNIATNETFCYEGVKATDVDKTKREWCELNEHQVWFSGSNSGSDSPCCGDDGYNLRDGLVSHWKFDETSGTTASDSIGSNTGTVNGASWVNGKYENALSFDGTDDYVDGLSLNSEIRDEVTISAWIKPNSFSSSNFQSIITEKYNPNGNDIVFELYHDGSEDKYAAGFYDDSWHKVFDSNTDTEVGVWKHLIATYDGTLLRLYKNGNLIGSLYDASGLPSGDLDWEIGRRHDGYDSTSNYFNGTIDDVRVYNRSLSAREVLKLYNNTASEYVSEGDNFYNGSVGSTRHVCYYGDQVILDSNKYACEHYDYEWMSEDGAHYPGTYSFTNSSIATYTQENETLLEDTEEFVTNSLTDLDNSISIVDKVNEHWKVVELYDYSGDGRPRFMKTFGDPQENDIHEFWVNLNDVSKNWWIEFQEGGTTLFELQFNGDNIRYHDGDEYVYPVYGIGKDRWYHLKVVPDDARNEFSLYFNGELTDFNGDTTYDYQTDSEVGIDRVDITGYGPNQDYKLRIDAWGTPTRDPNYNIGDNIYYTNYLSTETFEEYNETEAGDYYGTESFDYNTESGVYYGTYDFRDLSAQTWYDGEESSVESALGFADSVSIAPNGNISITSKGGHSNALQLYADGTDYTKVYHSFPDGAESSGKREFWVYWADTSENSHRIVFINDSANCFLKHGPNGYLWWQNGTDAKIIDDSKDWSEEWIHFKFDWNGNDLDISINGNTYSGYYICSNPNTIRFQNYWDTSWIDAFGDPTNDDSSHDGLGYSEGWNINPYDIEPLLNNSLNPTLIGFNTSVQVSKRLNGHNNVLNLTSTNSDSVKLKKSFGTKNSDDEHEFYLALDDLSVGYTYIQVKEGETVCLNLRIHNDDLDYYNGSDWISVKDNLFEINKFVHFKFRADDSNNKFDLWINGEREVEDGDYRENSLNGLDTFTVSVDHEGYSVYLDAWGEIKRDPNYSEGDNINSHGKEVITALESNGWYISQFPHTSVGISGSFNSHKKSLYLSAEKSDLYTTVNDYSPPSPDSGSISFYWKQNDTSKKFSFYLRDGVTTLISFAMRSDVFSYWNGSKHITILSDLENNQWYHHRFDFDCSSEEVDWYIDGKLEKENINFVSSGSKLTSVSFHMWDKFKGHIDSLTYSWDSNYQVGDNKIAPRCFGDDSGEVSSVLSVI